METYRDGAGAHDVTGRSWGRALSLLVAALLFSACATSQSSQATAASEPGKAGSAGAGGDGLGDLLGGLDLGALSRRGWRTDFDRHSVPLSEFQSGGPGKDGIPALDHPKFVTPSQAQGWLKPLEPVVALEIKGDARAYPIQILMWHEMTNDEVGGIPVVVTFCPLCNTAIAFDRRLDGRVLDFGVSGNLRYSDLVMYDRQTETWWQQATGEALVGELAGSHLTFLPASMISFKDFVAAHPTGKVLSRDTGFARDYGRNPYVGYDDVRSSPFLFSGRKDGRLPPMERVVTVSIGGADRAYPFGVLEQRQVVHDTVGGTAIVVFHVSGAVSPLDQASIAASRDIGAAGVFEPVVDGRRLTFATQGKAIMDRETGSAWNVLGQATAGPLAGKRLPPVVHGNHFWFAWAVFKPATEVYQ